MTSFATQDYRKAVEFLHGLRLFGARFGLENTLRLAELVGNPHGKLRFIHVAGTNGKGSTCAMLESIYRAAGLRVGLFTSPHLISFRERIQVNRELISEEDVVRLVEELRTISPPTRGEADGDRRDAGPTFFEFVTVMALRYFAEQQCDLVIWETGLGGRLDATNIVTPLASVITNIGFDHQQWLGDTLEKIAAEKAGIIKPGIPILTATQEPEALRVIEETARARHSPFTLVSGDSGLDVAELPLPGDYQRLNAALAAATVRALRAQIPVSEEQILRGLGRVDWPGRMQVLTPGPGRKILLDGAHNVAGASALALALKKNFPSPKPALILGILRDKDSAGICQLLAPLAESIFLVAIHSDRTEEPENLLTNCRLANPGAEIHICREVAEALRLVAGAPFVVITGSLYLVGEALERLHPAFTTGSDEKGLNEWTTSP